MKSLRVGLRALIAAAALSLLAASLAADAFSDGEARFMENKPQEAIPLLTQALVSDPGNEKAYLYLGVCQLQLGKAEDAIATFRKGFARATSLGYLFQYNIGNAYFSQKKYNFAEDAYGQSIKLNPNYASSFLNRANSRLNLTRYEDAYADYAAFLSLAPDSPKRPKVEAIMAQIKAYLAAEDDRKKQEAAAKLADEERKKQQQDDLLNSLNASADDTRNMGAGPEGAQGYDTGDFQLDN
jgi:tetratricopeptide (TPR) repeat protein